MRRSPSFWTSIWGAIAPHRQRCLLLLVALAACALVLSACAAGEEAEAEIVRSTATPVVTPTPTETTATISTQRSATAPHPTGVAEAVEVNEPATRLVVADGADGSIRVIDLTTGEQIAILTVTEPARVYEVG